jgi:bacteriorhodopsin
LSISTRRLGTLIWVLIFGGLFVLGIGIAIERSGESYGWAFIAVGAAAIVVGCVLIWVRSRMPEP